MPPGREAGREGGREGGKAYLIREMPVERGKKALRESIPHKNHFTGCGHS